MLSVVKSLLWNKKRKKNNTRFDELYNIIRFPKTICNIIIEYDDYIEGKIAIILKGHTRTVNCISKILGNCNSFRFVSGSNDNKLIIWDINNGDYTNITKQELIGHSSYIKQINILPNSDIVSSGYDSRVRIWDSNSGEHKYTLPFSRDYSYICSNSKLIACGTWCGNLITLDLENDNCNLTEIKKNIGIRSILMSKDGRVITGSDNGRLCVWNSGNIDIEFNCQSIHCENCENCITQTNYINCIKNLDDNLIVVSYNSLLSILNINKKIDNIEYKLVGFVGQIKNLQVFSGYDTYKIAGSTDLYIYIWEISKTNNIKYIKPIHIMSHQKQIQCLANFGNYKLVSGSQDKTLKIWNLETGICEKTLKGHSDAVTEIIVNDTYPYTIVSSSWDTHIIVWK